jgi:hypothetical protein
VAVEPDQPTEREAADPPERSAPVPTRGGLERLDLRVARMQVHVRLTFAFHAREVRFEVDRGEGFQRVFPETFSFHPQRHDPAELFLYLDDLLTKPRLLGPRANKRDCQELMTRLVAEVPRYLERVIERVESEGRLTGGALLRLHQDVAILSQIILRFSESRELAERRSGRVARWLLQRRIFRSLTYLLESRVSPEYLDAFARGEVDPVDPGDDPSESGIFHALESGGPEVVDRILVRMTERAFYQWVEGICLDEENQAFEKEDSPFEDRETELLAAVTVGNSGQVVRGSDLVAFLRRPSRDCERVLEKLETWFLRSYDIRHSSAIIQHAAHVSERQDDSRRVLTRHSPRNYAILLAALAAPYVGAAFAYERAPAVFDLLCSAEVVAINAAALWFLVYRFLWSQDLTLFRTSVPRILAGVIVGYLPVFLIDEVWDLADRSALILGIIGFVLGITTLLYIYVEVQRRLGRGPVALARARGIFLLGILEAFGVGVVMTSLVGPFMVSRNWSPADETLPVEALRTTLEPLLGQLPKVVGVEPFYVFPSAVFIMTFLSFFIGIFLQLMWEDLPITEPL